MIHWCFDIMGLQGYHFHISWYFYGTQSITQTQYDNIWYAM